MLMLTSIEGFQRTRLGQHIAAVNDYDTAIRLKSDYADAYLNRGIAKDKLGQHIASITDYDTAIRLKPDFADAYLNRGLAKDNWGNTLLPLMTLTQLFDSNPILPTHIIVEVM